VIQAAKALQFALERPLVLRTLPRAVPAHGTPATDSRISGPPGARTKTTTTTLLALPAIGSVGTGGAEDRRARVRELQAVLERT